VQAVYTNAVAVAFNDIKPNIFQTRWETLAVTFISCTRQLVAEELVDNRIYVLYVRKFCRRPTSWVGVLVQSRDQWWTFETWSRVRDSSPDPFLQVSFSKVSVSSRSRRLPVSVTSLLFENFNTATIWHNKISVIQCAFCLLYLQVRNDQSR